MSRSTVATSTTAIIESIRNPKAQEAWKKLKLYLRSGFTFDHVADLVPATLLSQQSGSYPFDVKLAVEQADTLGRGRVKNSDQKINFSSRVIIRCCKVEPDGQLRMDCFPPNCSARVNNVCHRRDFDIEGTPLDITVSVKFNPDVTNKVYFDVPTQGGFYVLTIILVRALSPSSIVERLSRLRKRPAKVTKGRLSKYHLVNSDFSVTSAKESMMCPLTNRRFDVPAQGEQCKHVQCFDLYAYLKLNALSGKWLCPFCKSKVLPAQLVVDGYWMDIIDSFKSQNNPATSVVFVTEPPRIPQPVKEEPEEIIEVE